MFIHLTAPVYSQGWSICGQKGIKMFFLQAFSPTSCCSLQKCWPHSALLPAGLGVQLLGQTRRGHFCLPLDASLGCKTMVLICLVQQTEYEQRHRVRRKLLLLQGRGYVLSVCLSPGLTSPLLPFRAGNSSMGKYTNGLKWNFEDIVGMKRVFEWILEVRDHSLRGRLCNM